ncbi:MAG: Potassium efflux system KefA protein / Small-conductance mechanosensitive channel [Labilithrix sp.]|nr:Potassium efflux system KefA protein / Small-conductance mechanosensitive channel [Labilithrix sp.]
MLSIVCLALAVLLGTAAQARAQAVKPGAVAIAASAVTSDKQPDEEAADSPRACMRTFLDLCNRGRFDEAAHYLDVPHGAEKRSEDLAHKLYDVLQERLWIDAEKLSALAQGKKDDALPAGTEELGKVTDSKGHPVPIRIVRHESRSAEDEPRWVFSQATLIAIDALHASLKGQWVREHLPAPLLEQGPRALYYWQWLALPVLAMLCIAAGRLLTTLSGILARRVLAKQPWGARLLPRLRRPVTMAWALVLFWALLPYLALTLRAEDLVERLLRALGYLAFFWALVRTVTIAGDEIADAKWATSRRNIRSITGVGVRLGKVVVGALALMVALSELGYPVTTVIAGLGIGGVALALAAQKTVENLFGSVSILADQPFGVGDTIKVDGVEGTVETIGLRSTRMRTVERTLVIIPNGKLADMRIESLGPRDRIRFATKLSLARDTDPKQIEALVGALRTVLRAHPSVHKDDVFVHLSGIGESSFDVDVAAPVETTDAAEFARIREELLLECMRAVTAKGAQLAVPARRVETTVTERPH